MKKHIFHLMALLLLGTSMISCLDDTKTKATCTYYVVADSITYSDTLDIQYDSLIHVGLTALGHEYYTFTKSAEVDQSLTSYAVSECDRQAVEVFTTNLKKSVTLSELQNEMYKANSDRFTAQGITNAAGIGLSPLTLHLSLWNSSNSVQLGGGDIDITQ